MQIQGPGAWLSSLGLTGPAAAERPAAPRPAESTPERAAPEPAAAAPAPAGQNAELWSVLTQEERDFFMVQNDLGPLTYGQRSAQSGPEAPRGLRVDLRA